MNHISEISCSLWFIFITNMLSLPGKLFYIPHLSSQQTWEKVHYDPPPFCYNSRLSRYDKNVCKEYVMKIEQEHAYWLYSVTITCENKIPVIFRHINSVQMARSCWNSKLIVIIICLTVIDIPVWFNSQIRSSQQDFLGIISRCCLIKLCF